MIPKKHYLTAWLAGLLPCLLVIYLNQYVLDYIFSSLPDHIETAIFYSIVGVGTICFFVGAWGEVIRRRVQAYWVRKSEEAAEFYVNRYISDALRENGAVVTRGKEYTVNLTVRVV